jgi:hypothetical protein
VLSLELMAVASRVPGVLLVNEVLLFDATRSPNGEIKLRGLELPSLAGLAVGIGAAPPASSIPGFGGGAVGQPGVQPADVFVPLPVIPEECR